jgi:ribosome recycling factor
MKAMFQEARHRMDRALESLESNLAVLRTGRANPALLRKVVVSHYGTMLPIDQVASITALDARTLAVTPWDRSALSAIEKAIRESDLGLNPANKGDALYIAIPALTEERRKELVKNAKAYAEEARIAVRNLRRELLSEVTKQAGLGEDERKRDEAEAQKITDEYIAKIDSALAHKEQDILN